MTLHFDPAGPMMRYEFGFLDIDDLNPEVQLRWQMSRWEMIRLGLRCIGSALRRDASGIPL